MTRDDLSCLAWWFLLRPSTFASALAPRPPVTPFPFTGMRLTEAEARQGGGRGSVGGISGPFSTTAQHVDAIVEKILARRKPENQDEHDQQAQVADESKQQQHLDPEVPCLT